MNSNLLDALETKVQSTVDSMEIMQLELDEEKLKNSEMFKLQEELKVENEAIKKELETWHNKVENLIGRLPISM